MQKEFTKAEKRENFRIFVERTVYTLEEDYDVKTDQLSTYQWRIWGKNFCIDIYPSTQKYFSLDTKQWGQYESLNNLINNLCKSKK
jgi:hypothetical protein